MGGLPGKEIRSQWAAEVAMADAAAPNLAAYRSSKKLLLRANTGFRR
jgi:hypothetical protein